jgi:hypothetical protein
MGAHNDAVTNCAIPLLVEAIGPGNGGNVFDHDTFGAATINGDVTLQGGDQITNNQFNGPGGLYILNNNGAQVVNNTFNVAKDPQAHFEAITVINSQNVAILNNTISVTNGDNLTTGIFLWTEMDHDGSTSADVEGNTIDTAGAGRGLAISRFAKPIDAKVQGNYLQNNAIGVTIYGDGTAVGTIDLGGGALGSQGNNHFESFSAAGTQAGKFAISLHKTSAAATVFAHGNLWGTTPALVVRDGVRNTQVPESVTGMQIDGSGFIDLGGLAKPGVPKPGVLFAGPDPLSVLLRNDIYVLLHAPDPAPRLAAPNAVQLAPMTQAVQPGEVMTSALDAYFGCLGMKQMRTGTVSHDLFASDVSLDQVALASLAMR